MDAETKRHFTSVQSITIWILLLRQSQKHLPLKAHNHLSGQFLNMSIYNYQQNIYTPNINLTKFEPLKPSRFEDISLLVFKISKEAVKQPCLDHSSSKSTSSAGEYAIAN